MKFRSRYVMETEYTFEFEAESEEDAKKKTQDEYFPEGEVGIEERVKCLYMSETTITKLDEIK